LILDARIHYPVLKHPTNTPHPPRHQTHPHPTPPRRTRADSEEGAVVCLRVRTRDRRNNPPPPTPPPPAPATRGQQGEAKEGVGVGACSLRTQQCATCRTHPGRAPASTGTPTLELSATRLRCFHPRAHTRRHERPREGVPEPAAPAHYRRRTGRKAP